MKSSIDKTELKKGAQSLPMGGGVLLSGLLIAGLLAGSNVQAASFQLGENTLLDLDTSVSYGLSVRVEDQDPDLLADINNDEGNRNFDKGSIWANRVNVTMDIDLQHENLGLFLRPRAYYDFVYDGSTDHDSPSTHNNHVSNGGTLTDPSKFSKATLDEHRSQIEMLDYFAYGQFDVLDRPLDVRVGSQVVNWGETLFSVAGIGGGQSHLDLNAAFQPGVEAKDLFLPSEQLLVRLGLTDSLSFATYYQWEWENHDLTSVEHFFASAGDIAGPAGERLLFAPGVAIPKAADDSPSESGQWGAALRYVAEDLGDTEFGLYYLNYHEKSPQVAFLGGGTSYQLSYAEDVKLVGLSFSSAIGDVNVSGEVSLRKDLPLTSANNVTFVETDAVNVIVSAMHILGEQRWMGADNLQMLAEVGYEEFLDHDKSTFKQTDNSYGGKVKFLADYFQVAPGLDLRAFVEYKANIEGTTNAWKEDRNEVGVGIDFNYLQHTTFGVSYKGFQERGPLSDRDFVSFNIKHAF